MTEIRHQRHLRGEGRGQPWMCVPASRARWQLSHLVSRSNSVSVALAAREAACSVFDVAHEASEFQSEPLPRKPQIWFWSDIKQKKHGQMDSHPNSLIYSDSLHWRHRAN